MQKIVLFIEPSEHAFGTPSKIGNLFMNRFAVDEDVAFEILKICELGKYSRPMSSEEEQQKGMDLIIIINRLVCFSFMKRKEQFEAKSICRVNSKKSAYSRNATKSVLTSNLGP